jgi:hypothetical protein
LNFIYNALKQIRYNNSIILYILLKGHETNISHYGIILNIASVHSSEFSGEPYNVAVLKIVVQIVRLTWIDNWIGVYKTKEELSHYCHIIIDKGIWSAWTRGIS